MISLTFGEQVKIVLSRKDMTIKELAEEIEARTGKKMSRQNLTQRLGRDNFQEQDMRMIADILGCPFQLSILGNADSEKEALDEEEMPTGRELEKLTAKKERKAAREEAKNRLKFFKHIIEECDGYLALYYNGKQIAKEKDLQRLFRFVWYGTSYKVDAEPNNGRGQADFIVSKGMNNQNIIEFKLASNSSLRHVFTQVKIYEAANCTDGSLVVIFYFTEEEKRFAEKVIEDSGYKSVIDESIFLIDCRKDNKKSASIA